MFASTTHSEYSMEQCSQNRPFLVDTTPKWKSNKLELAPSCPRCASSNTKFCYYNNYSLSQPRYFCKACRRYWTKGGSLRNVPVGGGCRKSRRARAARLERAAITCPGPARSPEPTNDTIDLALVFAKYLNRDVENHDQESSSQASSLDNIDSQAEGFGTTLDRNGQPLDFVDAGDIDHDQDQDQDQPQQVIPQASSTFEGINGHDFVYQNCGDLEMQGILGEELAGDLVWSDDMNLASFGSQGSTAQVQDFGLFSADDELRISANLVHDNWGSFDLSGYEIFSRP